MDDTQVLEMIKALRLFGMAETFMSRLAQAKANKLSYEELFMLTLQDQQQAETQSALDRRIKHAQFEEAKSFEGFELKRYSASVNQMVRNLMTGKFIKDQNHVIIMGPVGTGKTHLAQALGLLACQKKKKVCFIRANDLLNKMHQAKADESWMKLFNRYIKYDVLILDDFGLKALSAEQSADLYDLIASLHVKSTLIITTNRTVEGMLDVFHDPIMANAALDRITGKAFQVILDGESYRKKFIPKIKLEEMK